MSSDLQSNENQDGSWGTCPSGKLSLLNKKLKAQKSQSAINRRVVVTTLLLAILSPAVFWIINHNTNGTKNLGGVTCNEVHDFYPSYSSQELNKKQLASVKAHLKNCPKCRKYYAEQSQQNAQTFFLNQRPIPEQQYLRTVAYLQHAH